METVTDFIFLGSKITADGHCSHEIKRCLLLGSKVMTNLDKILKSRGITLPTKVHLLSRVRLFVTPWTVAYQALRSLSVHGIFQARVLEWVAISFSRGSSQPRD